MTAKRISFCVNSFLFEFVCVQIKIFTSFFSDLSRSRRKKQLDLKIVFALRVLLYSSLSVRCLVCTAKVTLTRNILLTLKGCAALVGIYFAWNNTKEATLACSSFQFFFKFCMLLYLLRTQHINQNSHFVTKVLTEVDFIDFNFFLMLSFYFAEQLLCWLYLNKYAHFVFFYELLCFSNTNSEL